MMYMYVPMGLPYIGSHFRPGAILDLDRVMGAGGKPGLRQPGGKRAISHLHKD